MTTTNPSPLTAGTDATYDFADDINLTGGSDGELQDLTDRHVDTTKAYRMEVSTVKLHLHL